MADSAADQELADRYAAYLGVCNAHDFGRLGEFVAADVRIDGMPTGLPAYAARAAGVVEAFPDYHWKIQPPGGQPADAGGSPGGHRYPPPRPRSQVVVGV